MEQNDTTTLITIDVPLTRDDITEMADRIAKLDEQVDTVKNEKKASTAKCNGILKGIEAEIKHKLKCIRNRSVSREFACNVEYDYETGKVTYRDADTGKILEERDMTNEERQLSLL